MMDRGRVVPWNSLFSAQFFCRLKTAKKKKKVYESKRKITSLSNFSVIKVLLGHIHTFHLRIVYGGFYALTVELRSCHSDQMPGEA